MDAKHTPGPWMLSGCSGRMVKPVGRYVGDGFIADVDTLANARLIAAAPDLLAALKAFLDWDTPDSTALELAEAAIAKATGTTHVTPHSEPVQVVDEVSEEPRLFRMSYAYDEPHYFDFIVKARSASEAEELAQNALDDGLFADIEATSDNSASGHRVFVESTSLVWEETVGYASLVDGKLVEG